MAFSIEELRPANPIILVKGRELELSLITLKIDAKIKDKFGKLENIFDQVRKNPFSIFDALWILLLDKESFNNSRTDFSQFVLSAAKTSEVTISIMNAIHESIGKSMPVIKNKQRYDELLKISQTHEDRKPCYGVYYDTLAKRYGYSIEDFYNLTLRQLHILLNIVGDQSYEDLEVQAALQGKKLKPRIKPIDIEEKDDKILDDDAKDLHARLMEEYKKKQGK